MKTKNVLAISVLLLAGLLSSCGKDTIDNSPSAVAAESELNSESLLNHPEDQSRKRKNKGVNLGVAGNFEIFI